MSEEKKHLEVGLVMPIAPIDDCSAEHWSDVKSIITESVLAIPEYTCKTKLVSESDSIGVIHKRIVQGLYNSDIIICDVSCKNPNVMFELGMRLAFDKPTLIIKDDQTDYSFDTGGIEHLEYPRDLRFNKINDFKGILAKKIKGTYQEFLNDTEHSPFLKNFGQFTAKTLDETPVPADKLMLEMMYDLQSEIASLKGVMFKRDNNSSRFFLPPKGLTDSKIRRLIEDGFRNFIKENNIKLEDLDLVNPLDITTYIKENSGHGEIRSAMSNTDTLKYIGTLLNSESFINSVV